MKFLSSSSSSTPTTTTFSGSKGNSLATMLRQFLCFNCLPTHPSDQFKDTGFNLESNKFGGWETEEKIEGKETPGIVARLMGLESMPLFDLAKAQLTPNSIERSGSMDYDSWTENESMQGHRGRVGTSLSFRQLPSFLELENDEFFVINFGNGGKNKEFRSKERRSETGSGKLKRRKAERCKRKCEKLKENQEPNRLINHEATQEVVCNGEGKDASDVLRPTNDCNCNSDVETEDVNQSKPINNRERSNGAKQRKEKEESVSAAKVETECNSENSSPVSVLDFVESILDPEEIPTSEEDARSTTGSNFRRKLSAELENFEQSPPSPCKPSTSSSSDVQRRKLIHGKCHGSKKKDYQRGNYVEMWNESCKMAEEAMMESNWVYRELWKVEDFKGVGVEFGLQILETLLGELVDQLVEASHAKF
ncbi:uncharacterized protein LOC114287211 [Camellia sinensis]|uniref:DUF3741 domain-containing protein n=1 Tax=Camellia sinensis var. sinensis TaxID=542762 RepID=A0A4S4DVR7_CAMSN|nr:uncharacterized protein LOC114287211 [Camellia sinensis]THG06676.1 hypothetical protein TEA_012544 [Camellia sinensis var. sinensis]